MKEKTCRCGSGKPRYELVDAAGVFCAFVCTSCEKERKAEFNPKIFTSWYDADQPEPHWRDDY